MIEPCTIEIKVVMSSADRQRDICLLYLETIPFHPTNHALSFHLFVIFSPEFHETSLLPPNIWHALKHCKRKWLRKRFECEFMRDRTLSIIKLFQEFSLSVVSSTFFAFCRVSVTHLLPFWLCLFHSPLNESQ